MINRIRKLTVIDPTSYGIASDTDINTSTNVITITGHGLINGCKLRYEDTNVDITGLTDQADYFVTDVTTNTFKLSTTLGGSSVNMTAVTGSGTFLYVSPIHLHNINDEVDGASVFGFTGEAKNVTIDDGQTFTYGVDGGFEIRTLRDRDYSANLRQISDNARDVYISGLTPSGFIFLGDLETTYSIKLVENEQFSNPFSFALKATRTDTTLWDCETGLFEGGFWSGENGLGIYDWSITSSDWTITGLTNSYTSPIQTLTGSGSMSKTMYFPHEGEQVTFSMEIDSITPADFSIKYIRIIFYDIGGQTISSLTTELTQDRKSVTGIVPTNTVSMLVGLALSSTAKTVTCSYPSLRTGTQTTYTKY